jgi:hypothetical protein
MRELLFWFGCIPTRSYIAYRSSIKDEWSDTIRTGAFVLSAWWLTGMEGGSVGRFGGRAFWAPLRPVHGALWGMYAITADWRFLAADIVVGVAAKLNAS